MPPPDAPSSCSFHLHDLPRDVLVHCMIPAAVSAGSLKDLLAALMLSSRRSRLLFDDLVHSEETWYAVYRASFPEDDDMKLKKHHYLYCCRGTGDYSTSCYWYTRFMRRLHMCPSCRVRIHAIECPDHMCAACCRSQTCRRHRYCCNGCRADVILPGSRSIIMVESDDDIYFDIRKVRVRHRKRRFCEYDATVIAKIPNDATLVQLT